MKSLLGCNQLLAVFAASIMVMAVFLHGTSVAEAYDCVTQGHCRGIAYWIPGYTIFGSQTNIKLVAASDSGDGFLTNESWLIDDVSPGCALPYVPCWIESGEMALPPGSPGGLQMFSGSMPPYTLVSQIW